MARSGEKLWLPDGGDLGLGLSFAGSKEAMPMEMEGESCTPVGLGLLSQGEPAPI